VKSPPVFERLMRLAEWKQISKLVYRGSFIFDRCLLWGRNTP